MPRILSYNVHRCVGADRRLDIGRVAAVIAAAEPDIVALQEVDVGRARTGGVDQAHELARRLEMDFAFNAALRVAEELYGDAILTVAPQRLVKAGPLPGYERLPGLEPRGALWVEVDIGESVLQVVNTHLGLAPPEQHAQVRALIGERWLAHPLRRDPMILAGDFNASRRTLVHRTLAAALVDARRTARPRRQRARATATFPAAMPMLAIDHVFASADIRITRVSVPADALTRAASDHRPLVVDFELPPLTA